MNRFTRAWKNVARNQRKHRQPLGARPTVEGLEKRCLLAVSLQLFPTPPVNALAAGPDGNVWFTEGNQIGRITPTGVLSEFAIPDGGQNARDIAAGSDGNLWFYSNPPSNVAALGRITPQGVITLDPLGGTPMTRGDGTWVSTLAASSDGNIYYFEWTTIFDHGWSITVYSIHKEILSVPPQTTSLDPGTTRTGHMATAPGDEVWYLRNNRIGRTDGTTMSDHLLPNPYFQLLSITTGPDGNGWFTEILGTTTYQIGRITQQGAITEFAVPIAATSIATGPDGNLWFTDPLANRIGVMTPAGDVINQYRVPWNTHPDNIITGPDGALWFDTTQGLGRMAIVNLTPSQAFVSQTYRDLLGREVDPVGLAGWSTMIDQGTARSDVVRSIEVSPEYQGVVVQQLYATYLHRSADPGGLASGEAFLAGGGTREQLAALLLGSAEYYQSQGGSTNDGFLTALYQDALQRSIDPTSLAAGEQALATGTMRDQLALSVLASEEHRMIVVNQMYHSYLSRQPAQAEQHAWVQFLNGNQTDPLLDAAAIAGFVGSDEYVAGV
jgi:streptogramin lyase